jgi:hypothetical protein
MLKGFGYTHSKKSPVFSNAHKEKSRFRVGEKKYIISLHLEKIW